MIDNVQNISTSSSPFRGWEGMVSLLNVTKRFNRDFIFRKVNYDFYAGQSYAITGPNGSGKSTLLQAIAGSLHLSEGKVVFKNMQHGIETVEPEHLYQHVSIAAPYLELIEEMTAKEFLHFHSQFKPLLPVSVEDILTETGLETAMDKQIRYFSSGMKQRVKLAQAIFSDVPVLLLDEPCTNLDKSGYDLYHSLIEKYCGNKLIIVSSNDNNEMDFCKERLNILDYKKSS